MAKKQQQQVMLAGCTACTFLISCWYVTADLSLHTLIAVAQNMTLTGSCFADLTADAVELTNRTRSSQGNGIDTGSV